MTTATKQALHIIRRQQRDALPRSRSRSYVYCVYDGVTLVGRYERRMDARAFIAYTSKASS